jgi:hypothetical protein
LWRKQRSIWEWIEMGAVVMEEKMEVGAEARARDLTISRKGPGGSLRAVVIAAEPTFERWTSGAIDSFCGRPDERKFRMDAIWALFFSELARRWVAAYYDRVMSLHGMRSVLASAVLFDFSVVWRESMGKSFEKEYAALVARYERIKPGWDLVSAWARHQNTYREWAHEARWLVFKDGYILGVESCCPKYASDITPAEARANEKMGMILNGMDGRGEVRLDHKGKPKAPDDPRLLGTKISREAMRRSMDLYLEETEGPRVDPDKEASAIVESAIAMMLARFIPEIVTPSKGKTPMSRWTEKRQAARRRRVARDLSAIRDKRELKADALRRLAFHVHEHGLNAAELPKTMAWNALWMTLDCSSGRLAGPVVFGVGGLWPGGWAIGITGRCAGATNKHHAGCWSRFKGDGLRDEGHEAGSEAELMDFDNLSNDEIRDRLAELMGWVRGDNGMLGDQRLVSDSDPIGRHALLGDTAEQLARRILKQIGGLCPCCGRQMRLTMDDLPSKKRDPREIALGCLKVLSRTREAGDLFEPIGWFA